MRNVNCPCHWPKQVTKNWQSLGVLRSSALVAVPVVVALAIGIGRLRGLRTSNCRLPRAPPLAWRNVAIMGCTGTVPSAYGSAGHSAARCCGRDCSCPCATVASAVGGQLSTWILRYSVVLVLRYSYSVVLSRFGTHTHTQFKWYSVTEYTQFEFL